MNSLEERAVDPLEDFLRAAGADQFPHARKRTLLAHLLGTREILRRWGQPEQLCSAGGLHSIYGTDRYFRRLVAPARRPEVRSLFGEEAERLAYLFSTLSRSDLFDQLEALARIPPEGLRVAARGGDQPLDAGEIASLVILFLANQAEQDSAPDGGPGAWLASMSRLAQVLSTAERPAPPIFNGCRAVISPGEEAAAREAYAAGLSCMQADRSRAARELARAAGSCPWVAEPAVWLAYLHLQAGELDLARPWLLRAGELLAQCGTPWDKRLDSGQWSELVDLLTDYLQAPEAPGPLPAPHPQALEAFLERLRERTWVRLYLEPEAAEEDDTRGASRFQRYVASFADPEPSFNRYPGLRPRAWHDPADFPLAQELERHASEIRSELSALDSRSFQPESEGIARTGRWNVLFFLERGRKNEALFARCPATGRILEGSGVVRGLAGLAYVSRLGPGTHVTPHAGPTNLRLRCHFAVQVPRGNCGIRVGGQTRQWEEGRCLVLDDSFIHEAWNHTAEDRTVLVVDLWHPDLTGEEIALLEGLHRYVVAQGESLQNYWNRNARARDAIAQ